MIGDICGHARLSNAVDMPSLPGVVLPALSIAEETSVSVIRGKGSEGSKDSFGFMPFSYTKNIFRDTCISYFFEIKGPFRFSHNLSKNLLICPGGRA